MGQVIEKLQGNLWRERQVRKITDKVFDQFKNEIGRANLIFEDLYIAVLLVYNDINKRLPGPHFDPPSKEQVKNLMLDCDINLDGELDREEFVKFIFKLTADTFVTVSKGLILTLAAAPTLALVTKKTTEGVPGIEVETSMEKSTASPISGLLLKLLIGFVRRIEFGVIK